MDLDFNIFPSLMQFSDSDFSFSFVLLLFFFPHGALVKDPEILWEGEAQQNDQVQSH